MVIGIGNEFRHDDAAGPAVIAALRGRCPRSVTLAVTDGEPAGLIELWAGARLAIVVDAVRAEPSEPGRVHEFDLETAATAGPRGAASSHALGLGAAIELGRALDLLPDRLHVYAIEGADFSLGRGLTPSLEPAIAHVADHVAALLAAVER